MATIRLCNNCLAPRAQAVPIGYAKGSQFDPTYDRVDLCALCKKDLSEGNFGDLARRYQEERVVRRNE